MSKTDGCPSCGKHGNTVAQDPAWETKRATCTHCGCVWFLDSRQILTKGKSTATKASTTKASSTKAKRKPAKKAAKAARRTR